MSEERFEVFAWRDGEDEGKAKGVFDTEVEVSTFRAGLSALPRRMKPHFIKVVHQPSGRTLGFTSDNWGGDDKDPPEEPDLTFEGVPDGFQVRGGMAAFRRS